MWKDAYLESRVMAADPVELIRMLYQAAIDSVQAARRHLAAGEIAERSNAIGHAIAVVSELDASLDHQAGGRLSRGLAELYTYMRRRLTEANLRQEDGPLAESEWLLATLLEGWRRVSVSSPEPPPHLLQAAAGQAGVWEASQLADSHTWSA